MSCSSLDRRPASRATGNAIIIFIALLLAGLSGSMPRSADLLAGLWAQPASSVATARSEAAPAHARRDQPPGLTAPTNDGAAVRSYHSGFETSASAAELGFSILTSLCAALLMAGFAPWLVQWLRRRD